MKAKETKSLTAHCSLEGATLKLSFDAAETVKLLRDELEAKLQEKGVALSWQATPQEPQLRIRIVQLDEGSVFLRWFIGLLCVFLLASSLKKRGRILWGIIALFPFFGLILFFVLCREVAQAFRRSGFRMGLFPPITQLPEQQQTIEEQMRSLVASKATGAISEQEFEQEKWEILRLSTDDDHAAS